MFVSHGFYLQGVSKEIQLRKSRMIDVVRFISQE